MTAIYINSLGPPLSSPSEFLRKINPASSKPNHNVSPLLQRIRTALRGPDAEDTSSIHTDTLFVDRFDDRELAWSGHTVVLSRGGIIIKKWSFEGEGESVQWACLGQLHQEVFKNENVQTAANYTKIDDTVLLGSTNGRPIFGPFTRSKYDHSSDTGTSRIEPAVFIFLRSLAKIYLDNGLGYSFSLPFIVRRAWAVSPHGVVVQRVLDPHEILEATNTDEIVLPTLFSITAPFSEAAVVGLTEKILGEARGLPACLANEQEHKQRPLKSVPPTEMIVWISAQGAPGNLRTAVTVDTEKDTLSVWQYVHIKPKEAPKGDATSSLSSGTRASHKKRQSSSIRRTSSMFDDPRGRIYPPSPGMGTQDLLATQLMEFPEPSDMPPLSSIPGMRPALTTSATMASLVSAALPQSSFPKDRHNSFLRGDASMTMDRMVLAARPESDALLEDGKMRAAFWMESLTSLPLEKEDAQSWSKISVALFDDRWDGQQRRCLMAICLPASKKLLIYSLAQQEDRSTQIKLVTELAAQTVISIRATRENIWDLLVVKPSGALSLLTHGFAELPIELREPQGERLASHGLIVSAVNVRRGTAILTFQDGWKTRVTFDIYPQTQLTSQCLQILALVLPADLAFSVHSQFLQRWCRRGWPNERDVEFDCLARTLYDIFQIPDPSTPVPNDPWAALGHSPSYHRLREDPVLRNLRRPPTVPSRAVQTPGPPHPLLAPVVFGLHILGETLRLYTHVHYDVTLFAPMICRLSMGVRPEWADYWKRLVPDAIEDWPSPNSLNTEYYEDRIPVWPVEVGAVLHSRLSNPDWKSPWQDMQHIVKRFEITPSLFYGICDPLQDLHELSLVYNTLADPKTPETQKRAENAVFKMVAQGITDHVYLLPLGVGIPLREAIRSCQLAPPGNWPLEAYNAIGRNDLAASAYQDFSVIRPHGYRPRKDFIDSSKSRETIGQITAEARGGASGEKDTLTGVELNQKEFTDIRFGQDRRLEEVARMLCSSIVPSVKSMERPDLSEHDQTKEHQNQVLRIAERTFALPYGRAMFTYGSVPIVTREAYVIPKMEYTVRMQPLNILVTPDASKLAQESINWGEFHNGVAAALRISNNAPGVESSWITFNKPNELSPEHAGFLLGLGLQGHLRQMLTWHTFAYLTPKHDLTSIGLLLGLAASNAGTANPHVTKLLAVHTPALLPTPGVDLNVSLLTQAGGISSAGLLYIGTKNRRMAEVCLTQISRADLVQPDISNEHRETYTYCSGLAFGMVMLGKGSDVPADMVLVKRLHVLIHGESPSLLSYQPRCSFDINLTSPAASIALGMMYLRTSRRDIADILTIPETVLELNSIQPSFLLIRTIARNLIMFEEIVASQEWIFQQIPPVIRRAADARLKYSKHTDDAMDLAYYNIVAGCCFVLGLKYAGTARQEAYQTIVKNYDLFSRLAYTNNPTFDHKIKRSTIRDGLNLISLALCMVMAGTGEITCLRRIRYSYGMYQQMMYHHGFKYGVHVATHMSLGLLFLGGGRFTLGTSDAAIGCMVAAFFPRFNNLSSDNKSFMQALRHLWVLAVEPRCLIARDVDTKEVVYLPMKISTQEKREVHTTQLISPTLIPDLDKILSIRVDTPRYWPFYLDTSAHPRHKEALLKSQTLFVKRRTAFLSYTEDPRGSRSLFVRSGASASTDGAMLDYPDTPNTTTHPAADISEFITSFSNNTLFLAFADHFARAGRSSITPRGEEEMSSEEQTFHAYCHAALLDSILQDKPETLQAHLTLYLYRHMDPQSRYFHLRMQDLRLAVEFYAGKVYDKRFSGSSENNARPGLLREGTVLGVLHALDSKLEEVREKEARMMEWVGKYARGEPLPDVASAMDLDGGSGAIESDQQQENDKLTRYLAWYLLRNAVPSSTLLVVLRGLARDAHNQCLGQLPPQGTDDAQGLDMGIREVLHATGSRLAHAGQHGSGWSVRSLDEIIDAWKVNS